jgi:translocation and assembly module TamA
MLISLVVFSVAARGASDNTLSYDVTLVGLEDSMFDEVRKTFRDASLLIDKPQDGIASVANLRAKVKSDAELLTLVLRAEGFYAGKISTQLSRSANHFEIAMRTTSGPRYVFGTIGFEFSGVKPSDDIIAKMRSRSGLEKDAPAIAATFAAAETYLNTALPELGFPFAKPVQHDLVVDHKDRVMNVTFMINAGARQKMGSVTFQGTKSINDSYVQRFIDWPEGAYYQQQYIDTLRSRLLGTSLFSNVSVQTQAAAEDRVNLLVTLDEASHRTLGATLDYSTAEGIGSEVSWEHRNMFGRGGVFSATVRAAEIEQSVSSRLDLPNFSRLNQTLSFETSFSRQNTDAFLSYEAQLQAGLDRVITSKLALSGGAVIDYSDVTDVDGNRNFLLASVPVGFRWDSSDDLLNPSRGVRASLITAPSINLANDGFAFLKSEFRTSLYLPVLDDNKMVVALRTRLGSIFGATNRSLPANQRFFAGGGGSIRGYGYQRVGPLGSDDNPFGGRSVSEIAAELRLKVTDTIGIVPFVEGGNVYVDAVPKFSGFRWGAGLGARYYTSFGPIRFDIAVPLDRQSGESSLQLYVSLGQAF